MPELKTKATSASVADFLDAIPDAQVREDCRAIARIMQDATKAEPKMWGPAIIGFGEHQVVYPDGREMTWIIAGFSPRKQNLTLYGMGAFEEDGELMSKLGPHTRGKGCLYVKRLSDIHLPTLKKLVRESVRQKTKGSAAVKSKNSKD